MDSVDIIVPVAVACIMPVCVVLISFLFAYLMQKSKMQVLVKAIENGQDIDPELLSDRKKRTVKEKILGFLSRGVIFSLAGVAFLILAVVLYHFFARQVIIFIGAVFLCVGIGLLVAFFFGRKFLSKEIAEEESRTPEQKQ